MRQRQPDRADLLPARRQAVENAPRDDQMRARIVVGERETEPRVVDGCGGADDRGRSGDEDRRTTYVWPGRV